MSNFFCTTFEIISYNIFIVLVSYLIGTFILIPFCSRGSNVAQTVFFKIVAGFIAAISFYAIRVLGIKTIMFYTLFIFLLFFILSFSKEKIKNNTIWHKNYYTEEISHLSVVFLGTISASLLQLYATNYTGKNLLLTYFDYYHYSSLAEFIGTVKIESAFAAVAFFDETNNISPMPYHYGDIWTLALLHQFLPMKTIEIYNVILSVFYVTIVYAGFTAIISQLKGNNVNKWFYVIGFLVIYTICFSPFLKKGLADFLVLDPKIFFLYLALIFVVLFALTQQYLAVILVLSILPFYNSIFAPAALSLAVLFTFFYRKNLLKKEQIIMFIVPFLTASFILAFYLLSHKEGSSLGEMRSSADGKNIVLLILRKWFVSSQIIYYPLLGFPFLFGIFWYRKQLLLRYKTDKVFKIICNIILSWFALSVFFAGFSFIHDDIMQMIRSAVNPITAIIILLWLDVAFTNEKKWYKSPAIIILLVGLVYGLFYYVSFQRNNGRFLAYVGREFIQKSDSLMTEDIPLVGYILADTTFAEDVYSNVPVVSERGRFIKHISDNTWVTPINFIDTIRYEKKFITYQAAIRQAPFWQYVVQQKREHKFISLPNAQVTFLQKYKINYLVIEPDAIIPELLQKRIETILTDNVSGSRFAKIKLD